MSYLIISFIVLSLQDVGRSCILITLGGKNIMLDCGMHMGFNDDVSYLLSGFKIFVKIFRFLIFLGSFNCVAGVIAMGD